MKPRILISAAALLVTGLALTGCGRTSVNLNDYLTLSCDGYDHVGLAAYSFELERMIMENPKAFGLAESYSEMEILGVEMVLSDAFSGSLDKTNGLSNGDTVTFSWNSINTSAIEDRYPVRLSFSDETIQVTGLEEAEIYDPFADITVSFEGIAPNGKVIINSAGAQVSGLSYTADRSSGLSNGDTITVSVSAPSGGDLQSYLVNQGKAANATEQTYTVSGLASYIQALDELLADADTALDKHAQDTLQADIAQNWSHPEQLQSITLLGNYLLTPKDASIYVDNNNLLYYVYKVNALNQTTNVEYYYYASFSDIMLMDDGTCSYNLNSIQVPQRGGWFSDGTTFTVTITEEDGEHNYTYTGYQDLSTLFSEQVTSKIDKYNYETTVQ